MQRRSYDQPGEEPSVFTSPNLCDLFGGCERCPGFASVEATGLGPNHPNPDELVFCLHECHKVKTKSEEQIIGTVIPHSDFGDPGCCGCLNGVVRGDAANIVCNECGKVVRTVPAAGLRRVLDEMELSLDVATAKCTHCGAVHVAPGLSELIAFKCDTCGKAVKLKDDPSADAIFGE